MAGQSANVGGETFTIEGSGADELDSQMWECVKSRSLWQSFGLSGASKVGEGRASVSLVYGKGIAFHAPSLYVFDQITSIHKHQYHVYVMFVAVDLSMCSAEKSGGMLP